MIELVDLLDAATEQAQRRAGELVARLDALERNRTHRRALQAGIPLRDELREQHRIIEACRYFREAIS